MTVISVHEITFLGVVDVLRLVEPLEALHSDGEAERHEEDRVHQGAQHLGAGPPEGVLKWWYRQGFSDVRGHVHMVSAKRSDIFTPSSPSSAFRN